MAARPLAQIRNTHRENGTAVKRLDRTVETREVIDDEPITVRHYPWCVLNEHTGEHLRMYGPSACVGAERETTGDNVSFTLFANADEHPVKDFEVSMLLSDGKWMVDLDPREAFALASILLLAVEEIAIGTPDISDDLSVAALLGELHDRLIGL